MAGSLGTCNQASPAQLPTKKEIRDSIPAHCFDHSLCAALGLLVRDTCVILAFGAVALLTLRTANLGVFDYVGWAVYGFWQGTALVGWWVLAHECGHGGFSTFSSVNNAVGWILHSFLLVPYFSWQYSHAKHHSKTNHLLDGETHNPNTKAEMVDWNYYSIHRVLGEDGFAAFQLITHLFLGWPIYLLTNATGGRRTISGKPVTGIQDHFRPNSELFPANWRFRVGLSSLGCLLTLCGMYVAGTIWTHTVVALMYWPAYVWVNFWLVLYTWLQHTKEDVPFYGEDEWTWIKGALSTIDRPYRECFGFFDSMHHHIGSTHVFHHLFSNAPCYRAVEATCHLRAFLEPRGLYNYDDRPILTAMWQTAKACQYVDGVTGPQYFRKIVQAGKRCD